VSGPDPTPEQVSERPDASFQSQTVTRLWFIWGAIFALILGLLLAREFNFFGVPQDEVIAYCAQDQVYAEPIFNEFERETGITVRAVYDSEAVKTVGMANRLLAERNHPQCDLFWGNEEMRTRQMARQNVFREPNGWAAFGYRSRRLVINTNQVSGASVPHGLLELTNNVWQGKLSLAFPQFGTTATHFHALRQLWGEEKWENWCRALAANKPFIVDGNSAVVKLVGQGEAWVGLTDSDDIADGQREGLPISSLPLVGETLLIPNTIGIIRNAPHPQSAQKLFEYLEKPEVSERLITGDALEGISIGDASTPALRPNWDTLLSELDSTTTKLNQIFLR